MTEEDIYANRKRCNLGRIGTLKVGKMVEKNPRKRRPWRRIPKRLCARHIFNAHHREYEWRLFLQNIEVVDGLKQKNKDEKEFPREYGRGKTIDMKDYQTIIHDSEVNSQAKPAHMVQENQEHTEPSVLTHDPLPSLSNHVQNVVVKENPIGLVEVLIGSTYEPTNKYTKLLKQWRARWNPRRTSTTKVGKIVQQIVERGDHAKEFQRDFVLYIISAYIIESMNGDCFFIIVEFLMDVNQIPYYNWCANLWVKLTCKRNQHTWHKKTKSIPNLLHQPLAFCSPRAIVSIIILEITKQDVPTTLGLPMGLLEVQEGSTRKSINEYTKLLKQ
ncbi:hypothetical protein Cgig2_028145 [Carnegiea gigantea]|uniref:Uncharacterized protein n=1 Tax=Carnegiea gigantea TaxID=171969 RepID=A0A9Q1Q9D7_9CARY|nr:hypothetical protein Cgig2_028145 [Carnegiea gigantea]